MVAQLGLVKVLNIPQNFCFQGSAGDILQQIAANLAVQLPSSITNVVVGNSEPTNIQTTAIWVRQDGSGQFIGLYTVNEGSWELLGSFKDWEPEYGASGSMTFTGVTTNKARFMRIGNYVYFYIDAVGTTGGIADSDLFFTLPIPAATGAGLGGGCQTLDGGTIAGCWTWNTTSEIVVRRYDAAAYALGSDRGFVVRGGYEVS